MSETVGEVAPSVTFPIALQRLPGVGRRTVAAVLRAFPTVEELERATDTEIEHSIGARAARSLRSGLDEAWLSALRRAREVVELHSSKGFAVIGITDPLYPDLLRITDDPPVVLFVRGDITLLNAPLSAAVVGTRTPTTRGLETARRLAKRLGDLGVVVVSGLAKGIDTAAHEGALDGGRTVAVLGTAIDKVYPAENRELADTIASTGALVSEYPIGFAPRGQAFVERDRIQAGMCIAVIPVQTGLTGGTQHTIKFAEAARRMLLVPQPSDAEGMLRENEGIVDLLARGRAKPISGADLPDLLIDWTRLRQDLLAQWVADPPPAKAPSRKRRAAAKSSAESLSWLLPPESPVDAPIHTMSEVVDELDRTLDRLGPRYDESAFDDIIRAWRARRFK